MISLAFAIYLAIILGIALYVHYTMSKEHEEYVLGSRNLNPWVVALSHEPGSNSGFVFIGLAGMGYTMGISSLWYIPGTMIGVLINYMILSHRIRKYSERLNALTITEFLSKRIDDKTNLFRGLAALFVIVFMTSYVSSQFQAASKAFGDTFGWTHTTGILFAAIFISVYTLIGGFRSVCYTDVMQGIFMLIGSVVLPIAAIYYAGGWGAFINKLGYTSPDLLTVTGGLTGGALIGMVAGYLGVSLGYPGNPHIVVRLISIKDPKLLRVSALVGIIYSTLQYTGGLFIGMVGRAIFPNIADPETVYPLLAKEIFNPFVVGILASALMAAIMSTADSQLLVAATDFTESIYSRLFKPKASDEEKLFINKVAVLVVGAIALILAWGAPGVVFWLVLFAWAGLGACFGPLLLLSIFWKGLTREGAVSGLIAGFVVVVVWYFTPALKGIIYELVPGFFANLIVAVLVSKFTQKPAEVEEDFKALGF